MSVFQIDEPRGDGGVVVYQRQYDDSSYVRVWSWAKGPHADQRVSESQVKEILIETMSKVNRDSKASVNESTPIDETDIPFMYKLESFPRFNNDAIGSGAFQSLELLQGHRGTYWTSSIRAFESMEQVVASAYDIVDRHF